MEIFCSDDIKELAGAMLRVQADINPAIKDSANPFAKSRYASLKSVVTASREALLKNGVWVVQYPVPVEAGHLGLVTRLTHAASGQWQSGLMILPLSKLDPQGYGSAMTYARRYSMASLIGLIVDDDDAEAACGRAKATTDSKVKKDPELSLTEKPTSPDPLALADKDNEGLAELPDDLPVLKGISYQAVKANDGRTCIVATGDTLPNKGVLSANGFKWNFTRKIWWRYAEAA